ncbi:pre-mRNA-splicing factor prp46 [Malassezia yamatoensis]|uniref:Pre-mRNA-splicing factor PRP46 n=1 Tax=Malassezia yamatoensis TaxID=253288 RepID=A0AAJ6CH40_9BASI|nr:pre-mRNA-splicing factor prp46 [Malassezia yamatoensis]
MEAESSLVMGDPSLKELAERNAKRTRLVYAHAGAPISRASPAQQVATRAHLATKLRAEYQDAHSLPEVIRNQQGTVTVPASKTSAGSIDAEILTQLEKETGVAPTSSQDAQKGAVALRTQYASQPSTSSNLKSALIHPEEATAATRAGSSQSMLNSALIRKKELAARQAQPAFHPQWKLMRVISGHLGWVRCMAVEPNNQWFATGAGDRMIKIWDMASGELKLSLTGHISTVRGLAISSRHPYMFSAGEDKLVKCWDLETNKVVRQYYGSLSGIYSLALHPTLDVVVSAGRDAVARVWDVRTKAQVHVLSGHRGTIASLQCQESDPQVITGSMDSTVKLWDLAAGKCYTTLTHHKKSVRALAIPPNEFTFYSGSTGGRNIKKWRCPEGTLLRNMTQDGIVNTLSVNADGVLFSGTDAGAMQFFDGETGVAFQSINDIVQPGSLDAEAGIFCSAFDQTGTRLITGGADKTIKVYREM